MAFAAAASVNAASVAGRRAAKATTTKTARRSVARSAVSTSTPLKDIVKPGVATGEDLITIFKHAHEHGYAIPAVNCTSGPIVNSCMEAAAAVGSPMIVQFSNGGGAYIAGKSVDNTDEKAAIAGCVAGALHVHEMAKLYGIPVILHTDHCAKKLLPWFDGLLEANEEHFKKTGAPLFSSHMLDLSEEPFEENLEICKKYLERMEKIDCLLEMELGITGGEEDGVDNTDVDKSELYSTPEEIHEVYQALTPISKRYSVAAAFGNVHGVYKPGNVELTPSILGNAQKFVKEKEGLEADKPIYFVFHGGSGSSREEIREAIGYGVVKMNIDTDTQWSFWDGVRAYVKENDAYLQGQIGNPEGEDKPNKNKYDPRAWTRRAELATVDRLKIAYEDLNCIGVMDL